MRETHTSIPKYLRLLEQANQNLVGSLIAMLDLRSVNSHDIVSTWLVSFQHIRQHHPLAFALLLLVCFFHRHDIPCELLSHAAREIRPGSPYKLPDEIQLNEALKILAELSFITIGNEQNPSMPLMVQFIARAWLAKHDTEALFSQFAIQTIASVSSSVDLESRLLKLRLLPHAKAVSTLRIPGPKTELRSPRRHQQRIPGNVGDLLSQNKAGQNESEDASALWVMEMTHRSVTPEIPAGTIPKALENDSGYDSASCFAASTVLSNARFPGGMYSQSHATACLGNSEMAHDIWSLLSHVGDALHESEMAYDILSLLSDFDDIGSQASEETTYEGLTGKALIRVFLAE